MVFNLRTYTLTPTTHIHFKFSEWYFQRNEACHLMELHIWLPRLITDRVAPHWCQVASNCGFCSQECCNWIWLLFFSGHSFFIPHSMCYWISVSFVGDIVSFRQVPFYTTLFSSTECVFSSKNMFIFPKVLANEGVFLRSIPHGNPV